jgi:multisubunit Na+/H+ antiporter MnhE subunit
MTPNPASVDPVHIVRDVATRAVLAVGLAGIALIHLLDSIGKYSETRYLFWMYIALIVASLVTAAGVLFTRSRAMFLVAAGLAASAIVGYVLSRTTGLPNAKDDIGNWTEPLGLASLFVEGVVIAVGTVAYPVTRRVARVRVLATAPASA